MGSVARSNRRGLTIASLLLISSLDAVNAQTPCETTAPAGIAGAVLDAESGVALPGARVVVLWEDESRETLSASDGAFVFCDVPLTADVVLQAFVASRQGALIELGRDRPLDMTAYVSLSDPAPVGEVTTKRGEPWGSGRILGRIVDAGSGAAIPGVSIEVGGRSVVSDEGGTFTVDRLPPGPAVLTVDHIGYGTLADTATVLERASVQLEVRLAANPVQLDPIVVTVEEVRDRRIETKGFYERRRVGEAAGIGHFIQREHIDRRNPRLLSHMLADLPGTRLICGNVPLAVETRRRRSRQAAT